MPRSAAPSSAACSPQRWRRSLSSRSPIRCCGAVRPISTCSTAASWKRPVSRSRVDPMPREGRAGGIALYLIGLVILGGTAAGGWVLWQNKQIGLARIQQVQAAEVELGPRIEVITVEPGPTKREVTLLGDAKSFQSVTLYSKVGGYLKTLPVDKGDKVKAGQVLAEIESAETDHQYSSALADLDNRRRLAARARELTARQFTDTAGR